jgi:hypothetical protein
MPFCSKCGNEVAAEDIFCSKCGSQLHDIELITENIAIDYPESIETRLVLRIPVSGNVEINPGNDKLVEGTISYDVPEWKPIISKTIDQITIRQERREFLYHWGTPKNDWQLRLGKQNPYKLEIQTGVSKGNIDLGGLPLTDLNVATGVGDSNIKFSEPNSRVRMSQLKVQSGVGKTNVQNILNANAREVVIGGGVGHTSLDFSGIEPSNDMRIRIDSGVGGFDISVLSGLRAIFNVTGLTGVDTRGSIKTVNRRFGRGTYVTEAYDVKTEPILEFNINIGVGGLSIKTKS